MTPKNQVALVAPKCQIGDWFILLLLANNLSLIVLIVIWQVVELELSGWIKTTIKRKSAAQFIYYSWIQVRIIVNQYKESEIIFKINYLLNTNKVNR